MSEQYHQLGFQDELQPSDAAFDLYYVDQTAQQPAQGQDVAPWHSGQQPTPASWSYASGTDPTLMTTDGHWTSAGVPPGWPQGAAPPNVIDQDLSLTSPTVLSPPLAVSHRVSLHGLQDTRFLHENLPLFSITALQNEQEAIPPAIADAVSGTASTSSAVTAEPAQASTAEQPMVKPTTSKQKQGRGSVIKTAPKGDPQASEFLRQKLGARQWEIFTARLADKRISHLRGRFKASPSVHRQGPEDAGEMWTESSVDDRSASVIDFLLKVEVVKSVLRTYIPHPYNQLKSFSHPYPPATLGYITLTRSSVLALCGWSNTQFSYWARRSEAVSVLAPYDKRLQAVVRVFEQRLRAIGLATPHHPSADLAPAGGKDDSWVDASITGKGLDTIIDEVKKRSGESPFLRGRHSSLDPFGTPRDPRDAEAGWNDADIAKKTMGETPAFQVHEGVSEGHNILSTENILGGSEEGVTGTAPSSSPMVFPPLSEMDWISPSASPQSERYYSLSMLGYSLPPPLGQVPASLPIPKGMSHSLNQAAGRARRLTSPPRMQAQGPGPLPFPTVPIDIPEEQNALGLTSLDPPEHPRKKRRSI